MRPHPDSVLLWFKRLLREDPTALQVFVCRDGDEFDRLVESALAEALVHLEKNSKHFATLSEDGYTAALVGCLKGRPFLHATQQTHSNGHVDITVEAEPGGLPRVRLGEAKIHRGPKRHVGGVEQLVGRYATGREGFGFVVAYVRQPEVRELIAAVRSYMDEHLPVRQVGACANHPIQWAFTSRHEHRTGEMLRVLHLACNVHPPN